MKKILIIALFSVHFCNAQVTEVKYFKPAGIEATYKDHWYSQHSPFPIIDHSRNGSVLTQNIIYTSGPILKITENGFFIVDIFKENKRKQQRKIIKYADDFAEQCSMVLTPFNDGEFHQILSLKDKFIYISTISDRDSTTYYASLITDNCELTETRPIFKTKIAQQYQYVASYFHGYYESNFTFFIPSGDETHFAAYYNTSDPSSHGIKSLKANELFQFKVFDSNLREVYHRQIVLPYVEKYHNVRNIYLTKNNQLITYSRQSDTNRDASDYIINIFGKSKEYDKELNLPHDNKDFDSYTIPVFNTFADGNIGFSSLISEDPVRKAKGFLVSEINEKDNSININTIPYTLEYITHINDLIGEKTKKKDLGIYQNYIKNIYKNSDGLINVLSFTEKGVTVFELNNLKLTNTYLVDDIKLFFSHYWKNTYHLFDLYPGKFNYTRFGKDGVKNKNFKPYNEEDFLTMLLLKPILLKLFL